MCFPMWQRADKTKDEYVTAINCLKNTALQQMILTKKQYGKDDPATSHWHGYQSSSPARFHQISVTKSAWSLPRKCGAIGSKSLSPRYLDKGHLPQSLLFQIPCPIWTEENTITPRKNVSE